MISHIYLQVATLFWMLGNMECCMVSLYTQRHWKKEIIIMHDSHVRRMVSGNCRGTHRMWCSWSLQSQTSCEKTWPWRCHTPQLRPPSAPPGWNLEKEKIISTNWPLRDTAVIFKLLIFKHISWILSISSEIVIRWMLQHLNDDWSKMVQVMAWCHQVPSHYLSQCWPTFHMTSLGHNELSL